MSRLCCRRTNNINSASLFIVLVVGLLIGRIFKQQEALLLNFFTRYIPAEPRQKEHSKKNCYCFEIPKINATFSENDAEFSFDYKRISEFRFKKTRPAPLPYISGDFFLSIADHIVDDFALLNGLQVTDGDIIFVKTERLEVFDWLKDTIRKKYILITQNGDTAVPGDFEDLLDDEKLLAWFGQNVEIAHPKLFPIPIGVANSQWSHGNISALRNVSRELKSFPSRQTLLYVNINTVTNNAERTDALDYFRRKFAEESNVEIVSNAQVGWNVYMRRLGDAKFVLSPPGNGFDCHRTWEALIMGAVPIVRNSSILSLYTDLPVMVVNDWNEVSVASLEKFAANLKLPPTAVPRRSKIWARYWLHRIFSVRQKSIKTACLPCSKNTKKSM